MKLPALHASPRGSTRNFGSIYPSKCCRALGACSRCAYLVGPPFQIAPLPWTGVRTSSACWSTGVQLGASVCIQASYGGLKDFDTEFQRPPLLRAPQGYHEASSHATGLSCNRAREELSPCHSRPSHRKITHCKHAGKLFSNIRSGIQSIICRECVRLVKELGLPVEHIVLPTFAVEHKLFVGPFSRAFPSAEVHVAPR